MDAQLLYKPPNAMKIITSIKSTTTTTLDKAKTTTLLDDKIICGCAHFQNTRKYIR